MPHESGIFWPIIRPEFGPGLRLRCWVLSWRVKTLCRYMWGVSRTFSTKKSFQFFSFVHIDVCIQIFPRVSNNFTALYSLYFCSAVFTGLTLNSMDSKLLIKLCHVYNGASISLIVMPQESGLFLAHNSASGLNFHVESCLWKMFFFCAQPGKKFPWKFLKMMVNLAIWDDFGGFNGLFSMNLINFPVSPGFSLLHPSRMDRITFYRGMCWVLSWRAKSSYKHMWAVSRTSPIKFVFEIFSYFLHRCIQMFPRVLNAFGALSHRISALSCSTGLTLHSPDPRLTIKPCPGR